MPHSLPQNHTQQNSMHIWAIILAAGQGLRLQAQTNNLPKQFLEHKNLPLYMHSAQSMSSYAPLKGIVYVFPEEFLEQEKEALTRKNFGLAYKAVAGGKRRQDSVRSGLSALPPTCTHVLVHDAARPFICLELVHNLCSALQKGADGVIPALPVVDTIKEVENGIVKNTLPRHTLYSVQTPQGFMRHILEKAHAKAEEDCIDVTDDAGVLEHCGYEVQIVEGQANNTKITHAEDLMKLHTPPLSRPCVGFGYDVHRFYCPKKDKVSGKERPLKLGGVLIPVSKDNPLQVIAHSDGDVLLHALMDALLGATALGDIGLHFPDSSADFDNADSAVLLQEVLRLVREKGLTIQHVDLTIITQKPKISPQRTTIQKNVAHLLGLAQEYVNVKATTEEGLGFTGSGEGIKATALVSGSLCQSAEHS